MLHHHKLILHRFILNLQTGSVKLNEFKIDGCLYNQPVVAEGI